VGVSWREGWDLLGDSVALVHINEIDAVGNSVPFGMGKVDFAGLFGHLGAVGYRGDIVVELELADRTGDPALTLGHLKNALKLLGGFCAG
jgi:sugar phosphate isomerase/epimerase